MRSYVTVFLCNDVVSATEICRISKVSKRFSHDLIAEFIALWYDRIITSSQIFLALLLKKRRKMY